MSNADADPATVMRHVLDAVGNRWAQALVHQVMPPDPLRHPLGVIRAPLIGHIADQCVLCRVDGDDRLPALWNVFDLALDIFTWCVPVRMRHAFAGCTGAGPTVVADLQQWPHLAGAHVLALLAQLLGHTACTLTGPAQGDIGSPRVVGSPAPPRP
jgi:hypothetical protein